MSKTDRPEEVNADQIQYWNSAPGKKWITFQEDLDTVFQSVNDRLLQRAKPALGERVLDIGCGTGASTMDFAAQVGPTGSTVGIDISRPLLDHAEERRTDMQIDHVEFLLADAQTHVFDTVRFDLIASRFGVMFFGDPVAAFGNFADALRPGGRMSFVSWAPMARNTWFEIPRDAAVARLGVPAPAPPTAPGPFAFQDQEYVLDILRRAGYSDRSATAEQVDLFYPGSVEDAAYLASNIGPSARIMKEFNGSAEDLKEIGRRVAEEFQQFAADGGVRVPALLNFFDAVKSPD